MKLRLILFVAVAITAAFLNWSTATPHAAAGELAAESYVQELEPREGEDLDSPAFWRRMQNQLFSNRPSRFSKAHPSVGRAFREVVSRASESTVAVYSGDERVALGTIVDADGYIVTKASELAGKTTVRLKDGTRFEAEEVKRDVANDLALLRIEAERLPAIIWREADDPALGSWLISVDTADEPLAVGVASVAPRAIRRERGLLGVRLEDAEGGALVEEVIAESAAEAAGLLVGDIVSRINGQAVETRERMIRLVGEMTPGDKVRLLVLREEREVEVEAVLGSMSIAGDRANRFALMNEMGGPLSRRRMGFESVLQHDTYLLPDQCGGPLCDLDGRAVGINIARAGRVNSYAVPARVVQRMLADLDVVKLEHANAAQPVSGDMEELQPVGP